ncbi:MAG: flavin reductase family protein [Rhodocyclales bacterium]|nr:flavin reductase family protein [Rhodocyclales bacterium]
MSERMAVPLPKAYLLLNHGPTVLVSSAHGDRRNVMAAAWNMALDFDPPKVAVVIDKSTLTRELVEASGEFVLNVPARKIAALTLAVGSESGRGIDKLLKVMQSGIHSDGAGTTAGGVVTAPLIDGCLAWLECRVIPEPHTQKTYDLFLGEVVAAWADPEVFSTGRWHFPDAERRSIHYISGGSFFATGDEFSV